MYDLRYSPYDELVLDFKLDAETAATIPDCVWATVVKEQLVTIKNERWDLVSFVASQSQTYIKFIRRRHSPVQQIILHFHLRSQ